MGISKSQLAIILSRLKGFDAPNIKQEQYQTDAEVAAESLWFAFMQGDIEGKVIADLGCGTGILAIGAALLGTRHVLAVDNDENALALARENAEIAGIGETIRFIHKDIQDFTEKVDIVIQNPPFGTKVAHADKVFLEKAFTLAEMVYSFHKSSTERFVHAIAKDHGFSIANRIGFSFPLKQTARFHKKRIERIAVSFFQLKKRKD